MSKNTNEIPFTELVERVKQLTRSGENTFEKIRGVIHDVYTREIPVKFDWNFMYATTSLTTNAEHTTGTVTINTGSVTAEFSSASIGSDMTGRLIKISGNDAVYGIVFVNSTTMTLTPAFRGTTNASNASYSIFNPYYALPRDFDRFPKDGGIYNWSGGSKKAISEESYQEYLENYSSTPSTPEKVRLVGLNTAGNQLVEFRPPPKTATNYGVDYIKQFVPLSENTTGLIKGLSSGATGVVGLSTTRFTEASTGNWFFRIDALGTGHDSQWYRVANIAGNQDLTLSTAFANTAITSSANYTLSSAPDMPSKMHPAVLFGALRAITFDQTDESAVFYHTRFAEVMSDAKRIYVNRVYGQDVQLVAEDYNYRR